jgi:hypothetical protein
MIAPQVKIDMRRGVEAILRRLARSQWCRRCGALAEMITAREAASLTDTSLRIIYHWAELGRVHWLSSHEGALVVCANSLPGNEGATRELDLRVAKRKTKTNETHPRETNHVEDFDTFRRKRS